MTRAISPISFELPQFMRVNKLFKASEWFELLANTRGISASTSNLWGKRIKLARKMHFQRISLAKKQNGMDFNLVMSNGCLNLNVTIPRSWDNLK